jgi:chemotaxis protein MotA
MVPLAGILIVLAAVVVGFRMESGELTQLAQPAEILIIVGAAVGSTMAANSFERLAATARALAKVFRGSAYTTEYYLSTLAMLSSVFHFARRQDARSLEDAVEDSENSMMFEGYRDDTVSPEVVEFVCDTLRLTALASISTFDIDEMMEKDLETRQTAAADPSGVLANLADSLPGFGIVAAVLGVILSMGYMRDSPTRLGLRIATALMGTFTGILLAYGLVSPLSERLAKIEHAESAYFAAIRAGQSSFMKGVPVAIAVECARRAIPEDVRPDFEAADLRCREAAHQHREAAEERRVAAHV